MTSDKKVKGTIHWVSIEHGINVEVRNYSNLFSEVNPDKYGDEFISYLEKDSLIINSKAIFEPSAIDCSPDLPVQMIRKGYYVRDIEESKIIFNRTVSLKEDKNK